MKESRVGASGYRGVAEIVVYTTQLCGQCLALKSRLRAGRIEFREIDIEDDAEARRFVRLAAAGQMSVPTVVLPDGRVLVEPSHRDVVAALA
jgi:mycoredoxin